MKHCVLDASAWLRVFCGDGPLSPQLERLVISSDQDEIVLVAPELILVEVAQALSKKHRRGELKRDEIVELWLDCNAISLTCVSVGPFIPTALTIAQDHGITVYDALYIALAEKYRAILATCDLALARAAEERGIPVEGDMAGE